MKQLKIFNHGNCKRDFTYIDDIVRNNEQRKNVPEKKIGEDGLPVPPYKVFITVITILKTY